MPEKPTHLRLVRCAPQTPGVIPRATGPTDRPIGNADRGPNPEPGPLMLDDDEQSRVPARRGGAGATGCAVRSGLGAALAILLVILGASLLLAADGLVQLETRLAQEARI